VLARADEVIGSGTSQFAVIQAMAPSLRVEVNPVSTREAPETRRRLYGRLNVR
jgi:hypothetical protein